MVGIPRLTDIEKIMVVGSGPIVIGQAAEFDYSGTQACKALKEEGYEVVLVNSNPATIMTDPETAEAIYVEPLNPETVARIIEKERPQGLLPTMGGQTGLNITEKLEEAGVLEKYGVRVLGTPVEAIRDGEDRDRFRALMQSIEEPIPISRAVSSLEDALAFVEEVGFPVVIRPAYTLGGTGSALVFEEKEFRQSLKTGLAQSMVNQVLVEEAILGVDGWGEFELEVMRDRKDNCIIICPMENFDPMGYHTGDSIVVAPIQTLNDHDFQTLRTTAIKIIRALKVEGGCNIQFGLNYLRGDYRIIEVNPRVSRSSALASKATGYPIARVAAKIAVGLTLDEIPNDITGETVAAFEPTIDYVVVKIPRWPFDKFRDAVPVIGTQMKSTGEVMAIGRTFEEAFQKAVRSLEIGRHGYCFDGKDKPVTDRKELETLLKLGTHERIFHIYDALRSGMSIDEIHALTGINRWFLKKLEKLLSFADGLQLSGKSLKEAKRMGFSDRQLAHLFGKTEGEIRELRVANDAIPTYKMVDTCAAEFEARTPYLYSTYEGEDEANPRDVKKVIVIGSGPIRIGQGIEFDYCCVHSSLALREEGVDSIMINNNPETVSTDFDTSSKLYFEPLTFEDVMNVVEREKPDGVIVQFGGQTSVNLALPLHRAGVNILGTHPLMMEVVEDREKFTEILNRLEIPQAPYGTARTEEEAMGVVKRIGYPVLVRPSFVLGGRAMEVVTNDDDLKVYLEEAFSVSSGYPILVDKYLEDAVELDVDTLCDGEEVFVAAIMEHIEEAGVHSGDSACVIPPMSIGPEVKEIIVDYTTRLAKEIKVLGLINIQCALAGGKVYFLEANPRASRTVPYVSKTMGRPLAKIATKLMLGKKLSDFDLKSYSEPPFITIKESVFPFNKFSGVDPVLAPEMRSTGEVMGVDSDFGQAYFKAQEAANSPLPLEGTVVMHTQLQNKGPALMELADKLNETGFNIISTRDTHKLFTASRSTSVGEVMDDEDIIDAVENQKVAMIICLSDLKNSQDSYRVLRRAAVDFRVPLFTTLRGAESAVRAILSCKGVEPTVGSIQSYHKQLSHL